MMPIFIGLCAGVAGASSQAAKERLKLSKGNKNTVSRQESLLCLRSMEALTALEVLADLDACEILPPVCCYRGLLFMALPAQSLPVATLPCDCAS